jgi:hypothetical protein
MQKILSILLFCLLVIACKHNNKKNHHSHKVPITTKDSSMYPMEEEYNSVNPAPLPILKSINAKRQLRYLYSNNGGLLGYYNDGTVTGLPKHDLTPNNILYMDSVVPFEKYSVNKDGSILCRGVIENPNAPGAKVNWPLINNKWNVLIFEKN